MRGSSVHFKRISSAIHAVSHASREVAPEYLLPEDVSLGTHVVIDDAGQVQRLLEHKLSLASRQAKATKDYSPMWEGVINLPDPADATPQQQIEIVKKWCAAYEKMTGHKVIRADVHLDEGFVDEDGKPRFNAHAHVMCDRTDDKGKVKKLTSTVLREVQNMTAEVTTLARGLDARTTGRKHIQHQHFRFDAEKTRLDLAGAIAPVRAALQRSIKLGGDDLKKIKDLSDKLDGEPARLAAALAAQEAQLNTQYQLDREALKASGTAKQADYQALKKANDEEIATLKTQLKTALEKLAEAQAQASKVPKLEADAVQAQAQIEANYKALKEAKDKEIADLAKELKSTKEQVVKMDEYSKKLEADLAAGEAKLAAELVAKAEAIEVQVRAGIKSEAVLKTAEGHRAAAEKLVEGFKQARIAKPGLPAPKEVLVAVDKILVEQARERLKTTVEAPKQPEAPTPSPAPTKSPKEAFLELYEGVKQVLVGLIDGMRLDAAEGRLGLFSSHSRTGPRAQVLCEVPEDKVMPVVGQCFDSRARPGKGGIAD